MKANEVQEKIYLQVCGDCKCNDCKNCEFEDFEDNIPWSKDKIFEKDIEYTRTDAFIEKACEWLKNNAINYWNWSKFVDSNMMAEDFKNYMKGE